MTDQHIENFVPGTWIVMIRSEQLVPCGRPRKVIGMHYPYLYWQCAVDETLGVYHLQQDYVEVFSDEAREGFENWIKEKLETPTNEPASFIIEHPCPRCGAPLNRRMYASSTTWAWVCDECDFSKDDTDD